MSTDTQKKRGRPAQNEAEGRRQEIIEKSAFLFKTQGYDNTSVRDIAAAVGMQSGSWCYYFKTKHDILAAIMEQGIARSLEQIEQLTQDSMPPRRRFERLVDIHLQTLLAPEHDFIPVLLYEWRALEPDARARIVRLKDRYEKVWEDAIKALQTSGDWSQPGKLDRLFMFGALNWTAQWYRRGGSISIQELSAQAVRFLLRTSPEK
jgi:AcrR family transcriptional regulator